MASNKAKAPTALASGDALSIAVHHQANNREIPLTAAELQVLYVRRRTRAAPSLAPTLSALAFGGGAA